MKCCKWRIAWSVACGLAVVMLCVLWVRSYWVWDLWDTGVRPPNGGFSSILGSFGGYIATDPARLSAVSELRHVHTRVQPNQRNYSWWIRYRRSEKLTELSIPYWVPVVIFIIAAMLPWLPTRFSVRTILIATALVAVGLAVCGSRFEGTRRSSQGITPP